MRATTADPGDILGLVHPLDIFEQVASELGLTYERGDADNLTFESSGIYGDYFVEVNWMEEVEALHLSSPLKLHVPPHREAQFKKLVTILNEQLWIGHFDHWTDEGATIFRYALILPGDSKLSLAQCKLLSEMPAIQWDCYYQAFQFVIYSDKTAEEAIKIVQFVTEGEA